jgi:hypothetical protein
MNHLRLVQAPAIRDLAPNKKAPGTWPGALKIRGLFVAVVADRFNRAAFQGFHAERDLIFGRRLLVHEGIATFVMTCEKARRGLATQVTVDALLIDKKFAGNVVLPLVCFVGHGCRNKEELT